MPGHWNRTARAIGPLLSLLTLSMALLVIQPGPAARAREAAPAMQVTPVPPAPWRALRLPNADLVADLLAGREGQPLAGGETLTRQAVGLWYAGVQKQIDLGPEPAAWQRLQARELALLHGDVAASEDTLPTPPMNILAAVVEFSGSDTISRLYPAENGACVEREFSFGPLALGQDPPPGPRDNFTFYKAGLSPADYQSLIFDAGPDAPGYGVVRPDLGGIDLSGLTLNNYLLEMSRGRYQVEGGVLPAPLSLPHAQGYYGYARYEPGGDGLCRVQAASDAHFDAFARDTATAVAATYGKVQDWSRYDADGDHIVDLFFIIHAGYGWQDSGNPDRLSSGSTSFSASGLALPQIAGQATPGDAGDDYFLDDFTVFSEQLDLGSVQEEFAHRLGLPDLYVLDGDASNGFWGALAAGVWGGPLGGARPVGHNLWQDWLLGWRDPLVVDYDDPALVAVLGRARNTPAGVEDGLIIRLPPQEFSVQNRAGAGSGFWSDSDDNLDNRLWRAFDLSEAGSTILFSFDAAWDIESGWDYGYVELSSDGGATWQVQRDIDGILTGSNPQGRNLGWGLTGSGKGRLRFALSPYQGQTVLVRLRYITDESTANPGWWVDNISLDDEFGVIYNNELEFDVSDWQNEGWVLVPLVELTEHYYLVEWRDDNGFDRSLNDPYQITYLDEETQETKVNRLPATTPGLQISYRNLGEPFDYELSSTLDAPPSYGPKYGLLLVESHYEPLYFDTTSPNFQSAWVGAPISGRVAPGDGLFSQIPTLPWTARLGYDWDTFTWSPVPLETKTWPSRPARSSFHDALGYTPGFFYPGAGPLIYLRDWDASAVVPAAGDYSTPVTWPDGEPYTGLYELEIAPGRKLGTGNPGDAGVQYGLHIQVLAQSDDRATVRVWQALHELDGQASASAGSARAGDTVQFQFAARNVGAAAPYFGFVPMPAGASYVPGSVSGEFFPVGVPPQQALQAFQRGELPSPLSAAAGNGDISGFAYLGDLSAGAGMAGGFGVVAEPEVGQETLAAELIFYLADGIPLRSYRAELPLINTPPQITSLTGEATWQEGDTFSGAGAFTDPDRDDWTAVVDYGDGSGVQPLPLEPGQTFSLQHRYEQDGSFTITVTIDDGEAQDSASLDLTVHNVAPRVELDPATAGLVEGEAWAATGAIDDPGADTWTGTVDYGDGTDPQPLDIDAAGAFALQHRYADDGMFTVGVTVSDGVDTGTATTTVTVSNDSPVIHLDLAAELTAGDTLVASGSFSDAGADTWQAEVDYGDGDGFQALPLDPGKTFHLQHRYDQGGRYTITVRISDDEGASDTATAPVTVQVVATLPLLADTWISSAAPDEQNNSRPGLIVRNTGVDNALFLFDRRALPAGAEILSATLTVHPYLESGAWGKHLSVLNVGPFDPQTVTFDSAPATFNPGASVPVPRVLGDITFDVAEQIAAWDAGAPPSPNEGYLAISMSGPNGRIALSSLESWPPGQEAVLRVTFLPG